MKGMVTFIRVGVVGLLVSLAVAIPHDTCAQSSPTTLPPLSGSIGVWGDYDNDGLVDVLLAGTIQGATNIPDGRFTRLYHNAGGGLFQDTGVAFPQLDNVSAAWGDYDNDGDLDLLISGRADGTNGPVNVTAVYRNDGCNHFTLLPTSLEPLAQGSVAWVDYDNDGALDIFVTGLRADGTNWVSQLYHNNGDGTFSLAPVSLPAIANGRGSWGDYDNDGDADLLLAGPAATYLLRNDGGIFVNTSVSIPAQHRVISSWGDFNGDGGLDFITSSATYPSVIFGPDYHPSLTRNDGSGGLTSAFDYSLDMWLFSASWGDIDNSGRACVVVSGWVPLLPGGGVWGSATKVFIYLGSSWQEVFTLGGWDNRSETWVDFNGDGALDIFTSGGGLTTFWTNDLAFHRDFPQLPLNPTTTFTALDEVMLSWQAPSNTPATGRGLSYNLRVGRTPGGLEVVSPMADPTTGKRLIQDMGNASTSKRWRLSALPPGTYYWSVQSIGQSYTGSPFSPEAVFTVTSSPPIMVTQPADQTIYAGGSANFTSAVIGTKPLAYQWRKDGVALSENGTFLGTASPVLTVTNAQPAQAGAYDLVVTNVYGAVTSAVAALVVHGEPRILGQPASRYVILTGATSFSVEAAGAVPLSYQWYFSGTPLSDGGRLSGTTSPTAIIQNFQAGDAGSYWVVVSNAWGMATSSVATVTLATARYVNASNATPSSPYTSWATAATVIQDALDACATGDWVVVTNGTYPSGARVVAGVKWNRVVLTNQQTVVSVNGAAATKILGDLPPNHHFYGTRCAFLGGSARLSGFTLASGGNYLGHITNGLYDSFGGAVYCDSNSPEVSDCIVSGNSGCSYGAGVFKGTLINCVLTGNNASSMGGGAYMSAVVNCTLVGNSAYYGGGAAWSSLTNCICQFNSGGSGQTNWYASTLDHSSAAPLPDGLGNTAADPLLVNLAGGDFRILAGSPCVNAGTNGSASWGLDLDSLPRVVDGVVDMGAYEVQHVPWVVAGPVNQSAVLTSNALFTVSTVGDEPLICRWQKDGADLADDGRIIGAATRALAISNVSTQDLGGYRIIISNALGVATSTVATLTILFPPTITVQPADQIVPVGAIASFGVLASGTAPLAYQWRKDGANLANGGSISGATSATLQMANASSNYLGSYDVLVSNPYGLATSTVASLTLVSLGITNQPASRSVPAGTNVTFAVGAAGFTPIGYQWRFNQADLAGQTNAALALTNVQSGNGGDYVVVVTNAYSALTSAVATLTVVPTAPVLTTQTASCAVSVGQNVSFSVAAKGSEPMTCQWQFNGANLPGAIGFTLVLTNVNASFSGTYRAAVSNVVGIGFSTNVTLVVSPVLIWGLTNNPQLLLNAAIPATATNVIALAAGGSIDPSGLPCMALRADGTMATWGYYSRDQAPPTNAVDLVAISLGDAGSTANNLVLRADGTVVNWTGSTKPPQPVALTNGNIVAVAAGGAHQLALRDDGTVIAWGSNTSGQTNVPPSATNVIAIAAGTSHSLALRADGRVVGWGLNTSGQATALNNAANVVAIAAGGNQSLALLADGSVVGQVVLNTPTVSVTYGPPPGNTNNKIAIATGRYHSLALGADRTINGWGATNYGQITIAAYATNVVAIAAGADDSLALVRDPFAPPIPPRIARPPLGRQVIAGQSVVFNALAVGGLPLRYQWLRDGAPVAGQTNAWLAVTNVLPGDGGNLQLVAMNDFGSVTSAVAVVTVSIPQPQLTASGVAGGGFRIFFQSVLGLLYVTEYKASLGAGAWTELERRIGAGSVEMVTDISAGGEARFYRLRVE
jgi:hypothetical protein